MKLRDIDINWVVRRLPGAVSEAMKSRPGKCFLAGGFVRACVAGEEPKDIDLFAPDPSAARALAVGLFGSDDNGNPACIQTEFAYTGTVDGQTVQVIHRWGFESAADVLSHFDFTTARAVVWWEGYGPDPSECDPQWFPSEPRWEGECDDAFYADLAARRLVYADPEDPEPGGTMLRVIRFAARGYRIPLDSLSRIIAAMAAKADPRVDRASIAGAIAENLRSVDPLEGPE